MIGPKPEETSVSPPSIEEKKEPKSTLSPHKDLTLDSVKNFSKDLFSKMKTGMEGLEEKRKIGFEELGKIQEVGLDKIKSLMIQTFPNISKVLKLGEKNTATGIENILERLATDPLKKLVIKGDLILLTDRKVGFKPGADSQKTMRNLLTNHEHLHEIMKDPEKGLKMMSNLRKSDWGKAVFASSDELNLKAIEIEAKLRAQTPEMGRGLLEGLNKAIRELSDESNKKFPEAKLALTVVLIQLKEGIKSAGYTRDAIAILKTLENSGWVQSVSQNTPELKMEFEALKFDLDVQKTRQIGVLVQIFDRIPDELKEKIGINSESFKAIEQLAGDKHALMPLDILALGFNSMMTLNDILNVTKELLDSKEIPLDQQIELKKILVPFVREIERNQLNTAELSKPDNAALFEEITGNSPKVIETKQLLPGMPVVKQFDTILLNVRKGEKPTEQDIQICAQVFTSISVSGFAGINAEQVFNVKDGAAKELGKKFDRMHGFVIDCILSDVNPEIDDRVISFFLKVAKRCVENNDLNSAQAILFGVKSVPVHRLYNNDDDNKNIVKLEDDDKKIMSELDALFSTANNSVAIRSKINEHIANHDLFIPSPAKAFGDITFAHDGNPDSFVRLGIYENPLGVFQHAVVNARKLEKITTAPFVDYMRLNTPKDKNNQQIDLDDKTALEDARYKRSLEIKPREA